MSESQVSIPNIETQRLIEQILSCSIGGCTPVRYLARGASALVFEANRGGQSVALKVFDPKFLQKFDDGVQEKRIERQLVLKGARHPHLIEIIDGGLCNQSGFHFLVMPFIDSPSLDQMLDRVPRDRIRPLVAQIADAARYLETVGLVHRDIKPANIIVDNEFEIATLLDLGVVRPLGLSDLTDTTDTTPFVGTTRYSPPEFLFRDMEETPDAWRAVTFYQLGGVLHDLIMRKSLFHGTLEPYARLVRAVLVEEPVIECDDVPGDIIRIAQLCLLKDPVKRLLLVNWESFSATPTPDSSVPELRKQIERLRGTAEASDHLMEANSVEVHILESITSNLIRAVRSHCLDNVEIFPPISVEQLSVTKSDCRRFAVSFSKSTRHRLPRLLHCVFEVTLQSASPALVAIAFAAGTSLSSVDMSVSPRCTRVFEGSPGDEANDMMLVCVYRSLRDALSELALPADAVGGGSDVMWKS